jgi:hypothetical protein
VEEEIGLEDGNMRWSERGRGITERGIGNIFG